MEKVVITIEGTASEVAASLCALVAGFREAPAVAAPSASEPRRGPDNSLGANGATWLGAEVKSFFKNLQRQAKEVLVEIAHSPGGYDRDQLMHKLNLSGRSLAGSLSSVGHTLRKLSTAKPRPITLDPKTKKYHMLPEVAKWISEHGNGRRAKRKQVPVLNVRVPGERAKGRRAKRKAKGAEATAA